MLRHSSGNHPVLLREHQDPDDLVLLRFGGVGSDVLQ